jgi:hypothetical protein
MFTKNDLQIENFHQTYLGLPLVCRLERALACIAHFFFSFSKLMSQSKMSSCHLVVFRERRYKTQKAKKSKKSDHRKISRNWQ